MSARPARRAAAARRKIVTSDSEDDLTSPTQTLETPTTHKSRSSLVGSRASFDEEYTPRQTRISASNTPVSAVKKSKASTRAPLSETKRSRTQAQTPRNTMRKECLKANVNIIKEGYEDDLLVHDAQKENRTPGSVKTIKRAENVSFVTTASSVTTKLTTSEILPLTLSTSIPVNNLDSTPVLKKSTGPKTRIVISQLVLENFKSYAGQQTIGPFHKSFSAVVGPNGSGKSNVIDSLLFVFGFRASKMRQGKISALIHNSAAHPDLGHCSVEVHFETIYDTDDPQDYRVVEKDDIIIARKAFKNNSSKYTINGRESSFTEVTTLLKDRGIDLDHKRFLILQGEVESIAQMRPKAATEHDDGLLEYLEDIIGTSKYKAPIEGALERMEALSTICQEKTARVQIVEKERTRLEEQKNLAVQQILAENDLAIHQSALYQVFIKECTANISITKDVILELEEELKVGIESYKGNEELIRSLETKHKSAMRAQEELNTLLSKYTSEAARSEKAVVQIQEKTKHLTAKQKKVTKSNSSSEFALKESKFQFAKCEEEISRFAAEIQDLGVELAKEDKELSRIRTSLRDKTQVFTDQIESKQKQKQPWDTQIAEERSALQIARSELEVLNEKSAQAEKDLLSTNDQLQSLEAEGLKKAEEIKDIDVEISRVSSALETSSADLKVAQKSELVAKQQYTETRQKADEAKSNLAASRSQGDVLSGLTRLRDSGRITGFHGRLGDLGKIDDKYDVAISTACPALQNIVVDTVEVGQACIDHLRQNNLGRAMFILLDRLRDRDLKKIQTPENVPRLFDLVQLKEAKFGPAFYSVLQDTLVATNLEQANRIAYGKTRWRVVTLDGQLIDKSGTMTGGGTKVSKGSMSSKFAATESATSVAKLETLSQSREVDLNSIRTRIISLETEQKQLTESLPRLETRKSVLLLDLEAMSKNRSELKRRIKDLRIQINSGPADKQRVAQIEAKILGVELAIKKLTQETVTIEEDIKVLQEKVLEVGGIKLRTQKSKVDGLRDQIEALNLRSESSGLSMSKAQKDIGKHSATLANGEIELAAIIEELRDLENECHKLDSGSAQSKEIDDVKYALEDSNTQLKQLKNQLDQERDGKNAFRAKELELRNSLDEHKKRTADDSKKLNHWTDKVSRLSVQELSPHFRTEDSAAQALTTLTDDELSELDKDQLKANIAQLEEQTQNTRVDVGVLDEYVKRCEEHAERVALLTEAVAERDTARSTAEDLRRRRLTEFMTGFNIISLRLKEMYQMITMGGNAELELVDSLDPFSEGILFSVMPPKKSWKNISNLSGGEKTLSSLALVFALHHYKPTPLYVMDEIDAALDFRNVSIVANYIKERTKNAQFIVISLRNNMFELSARLVGIYKTNNMTKSIAIENTELVVKRE